MGALLRAALHPPESAISRVDDPSERRALIVELLLVGVLTFGFSALYAILSLLENALTTGIGGTTVALNPVASSVAAIDAIRQGMSVIRLLAIGGLGAYLLWRTGIGLRRVGLARPSRADVPPAVLLAAVIGLPGLALVAVSQAMGANSVLDVAPTDDLWWRIPVLALKSFGNGFAEEVVVVGYFMTRLRQLGLRANVALWSSAVLRGAYHAYQGLGAAVGNVVMGLVYGRWYQVTGRLWPLVLAHALIDTIAFIGYAVLTRTGVLG
ncbi:CAAX protease [Gordonia phthalatica]|uniref:CAAX protease n=1 Tax=Gordonia phthalatica TaxID=1136941 RepID=A0A0N9MZ78_9ACTN|nr:CAAX protease [Gordonia phthalatica]